MKGLTRGLQLIADYLRFLIAAIKTGNTAALNDAVQVASTWLSEATNEAGTIKLGWTALVFGDPFAGSRQAFAALKLKYPGLG